MSLNTFIDCILIKKFVAIPKYGTGKKYRFPWKISLLNLRIYSHLLKHLELFSDALCISACFVFVAFSLPYLINTELDFFDT